MPHISVNGLDIHYKEKGAGFPVVLIHGYTGSLRNWTLQMPLLTRKYRSVSLDLRGHGLSGKPTRPDDYSLELMAADVHGLLQALDISECYLAGHSMGGMVAQEFVLRHPEVVRALVLVDTTAQQPAGTDIAERARLVQIALSQGMEAVFEENMKSPLPGQQWAAENPQFIDLWRQQFLMTSAEAYVYCAQAVRDRRPLLDELSQIRVPTLIVCGALDEPFLGPSRRIHARIAGSQLVIIEGSGHTPALEKPQEFNQALLSFLAEVDSRSAQ